jgi:hypothetical protein
MIVGVVGPDIRDQVPVPVADIWIESFRHIVWSAPALGLVTVIYVVSLVLHVPEFHT